MKNKIIYTFNEIEQHIDDLVYKINKDKIKFSKIVTLTKGGLIPARLVAKALDIDEIYVMGIKLYTPQNTTRTEPIIYQRLDGDFKQYDKILIIDDIIDTGESVNYVKHYIMNMEHKCHNIKIGSVFYKKISKVIPDYYGKIVDDNEWVVFPWE